MSIENAHTQVKTTVPFLGLSFFSGTVPEVARRVEELSRSQSWSYVATPNASHFVRIADSPKTFVLYSEASLLLFDSRFVRMVARILRLDPPAVVTGSDLTAELFLQHINSESKVCIIGCDSETIANLCACYPVKNIAHYCPPMGFYAEPAEVEKTVKFVGGTGADYTFFAIGSPQQEMIANLVGKRGGRGVGLCVGAAVAFLTGQAVRAPTWIQELGFEWLYRFMREPRRLFARYFIESPRIFALLLRARIGGMSK